jgi:hypothetical protein
VSRPAPAATSTPKKKTGKDRPKAVKKSPHLAGPMSEVTKESNIPVIDIGAYVHRSTEERIKEVSAGKTPGKIKRPMNAFMLYRKAYQNRAKEWCSQHNHQVVSQVCGDSWPLEPDHVRAQFTEWAKIERDNHQKAHPSYKFTPSKPHKPKPITGKRGRDEEEEGEDLEDPDWHGSKRMRRTPTPLDRDHEYQHSRSLYHGGGYQQHNRSTFHATNPGKQVPPAYDGHASAGGHYYQTMQVRDGAVEHVMYKKTPSPAMMHHQHPGGYDMGAYGPPPPHMQHHPHQQYINTQQHQQHQQQQQQQQHQQQLAQHHNPQYSQQTPYSPQHVDPSLSGTAGELLDLASSYSQYPHQADPAQWHDGQGGPQLYLDQMTATATFDLGQYDLPGGGEFGDASLLVQPEQEKIFNQEPWQVLDSSLLAEGDDWVDGFDLQQPQQQPATAGQLEVLAELERK